MLRPAGEREGGTNGGREVVGRQRGACSRDERETCVKWLKNRQRDDVERREEGMREQDEWLYTYVCLCRFNIICTYNTASKVFMRDADQVEAWISTQESFIAGDDYGVSAAHTHTH